MRKTFFTREKHTNIYLYHVKSAHFPNVMATKNFFNQWKQYLFKYVQ